MLYRKGSFEKLKSPWKLEVEKSEIKSVETF